MLHNKASEGLIKPDRLGYDLYSGIADTKAFFLKYCKPFEKRIRSLVPNHRVVLAGDGEASTTVSVPGFLVDAKSKSKKAPLQVDLQFVEHHKTLYLDLNREFTKSEYAPQSEASLQNFKTLLLLEIAILLGCDLEWATGSSVGAAVADPPVLAAGAAAADDDASNSDESDAPDRAKHGAAARAGLRRAECRRRHQRRRRRRRRRRRGRWHRPGRGRFHVLATRHLAVRGLRQDPVPD